MNLGQDTILNNRYQILRVLSDKGGMGVIYQAHDLNLNGTVVIKQSRFTEQELRRQYPNWPIEQIRNQAEYLRKAFEREAKLLFGLRHSALPRVIDYFATPDGNQFFVMEFIPGKDFAELLNERLRQNQGPFPLDQVLGWAEQILDVLHYLHTDFDPPIIHRDIKPMNLKLMPSGQVILLDFGLAKGARPGMSVVESILGGTPQYAPLEQIDRDENERQESDPRSDLYSLALTLHYLLSGREPVRAVSRIRAIAQGAPDPLRPLSEIVSSIPAHISAALERAAEVYAKDRPATAAEFRQLLHEAVAPTPPPETEPPTIVRPKPAQPKSFSEDLGNGVKLEMIHIPGGSFLMGSPEGVGGDDEHPQHHVTLSPFYLGKYPVTQAQWRVVMGNVPSRFRGNELPVEGVSWEDAVKFCEVVSKRTGKTYRLPTEAEWEYACRAGSTGLYCFGDDESQLDEYAWYAKNSGDVTHPVGKKKPNASGLFDMHGNIWEWCEDDWFDSYTGAPVDGRAWVDEPSRYSFRVFRGGGWGSDAVSCRSARRFNDLLFHRGGLGVRLLMT
ncbi:MAG: SUMF1/EgtB/PvdO family nonheme iron enzyme [Blastocatellia bacterium]